MSSTEDPTSAPPTTSALDVVVPVALGVLVGAGVGVVLGRTVLAPKRPAPPATAPTVRPGGAPLMPEKGVEADGPLVAQSPSFLSTWARKREPVRPKATLPQVQQPTFLDTSFLTTTHIQRLLDSRPSADELTALARGPRWIIDSNVPNQPVVLLGLQKTLRAAMAIQFDSPAPLMNTLSLWDYIVQHVRTIRLVADNSASAEANPSTGTVVLPYGMVNSDTYMDLRADGAGIWSATVILAHEARHIDRPDLIHNCDDNGLICGSAQRLGAGCPVGFGGHNRDSTLSYEGAGAVHYYAISWLANHSGDWLNEPAHAFLRRAALGAKSAMFCDPTDPSAHTRT